MRSSETELIDDPSLPAEVYAAAMRDLEKVNRVLFASRPLLSFLKRATNGMNSFRLIDVGSGHGDNLRRIGRWAKRRGIVADLTGVDLSPAATAAATAATQDALPIRYITANVLEYEPDPAPDFIVSSLFAHHLTPAELHRFLLWMESHTRRGWQISDLHRHALAGAGFRVLAGALRWHPVVRHDGAISVRRGFTRGEWTRLLHDSGIGDAAEIRWRLPFRFTVERLR